MKKKEEPALVETHLQVNQLMSTEETIVVVADIDSSALAQKFKDRNLP